MVQESKWNPYKEATPTVDRYGYKPGVFYAWKARASEYLRDKNPLKTYQSPDVNRVPWTFWDAFMDPNGTFIGRETWTEEEINESLKNRDRYEMAVVLKNTSDYNLMMGSIANDITGQGVGRRVADRDLEKEIAYTRMSFCPEERIEVEGELLYERRTRMDINFLLHKFTLGYYKWDPKDSMTTSPTHIGYGDGTCHHEKPLRGPNIRGRYARDLRGDKDVLYEFTNPDDSSNWGSDSGWSTYGMTEKQSTFDIRNKFKDKQDLK